MMTKIKMTRMMRKEDDEEEGDDEEEMDTDVSAMAEDEAEDITNGGGEEVRCCS